VRLRATLTATCTATLVAPPAPLTHPHILTTTTSEEASPLHRPLHHPLHRSRCLLQTIALPVHCATRHWSAGLTERAASCATGTAPELEGHPALGDAWPALLAASRAASPSSSLTYGSLGCCGSPLVTPDGPFKPAALVLAGSEPVQRARHAHYEWPATPNEGLWQCAHIMCQSGCVKAQATARLTASRSPTRHAC
jgi:hypothetical protein